ncbi:hypothetical protein HPP92_023249 [Vanilla planifolia]|uniref:Uncharacterized protein n=1 Tax=Vanilla planifolia TaxID=51239 RepID=A0A835UI10_VANPL|nr:hypothetical protein HPP92_023249 [Vanilla planifolia]
MANSKSWSPRIGSLVLQSNRRGIKSSQIYRIGTMFCDDKYGTQGLSQDIIGKMRAIMTDDSTNIPNSSFLLDDDSSYAHGSMSVVVIF